MGQTIKLKYLVTPDNDPLTRNTFILEGDTNYGDLCYTLDAVEYELPEGYTLGAFEWGEPAIVDPKGMCCDIEAFGKTPQLISAYDRPLLRMVR